MHNITLLTLIEASVTLNSEIIASGGFKIEFDGKSLADRKKDG